MSPTTADGTGNAASTNLIGRVVIVPLRASLGAVLAQNEVPAAKNRFGFPSNRGERI
jgi:hypothetical protein